MNNQNPERPNYYSYVTPKTGDERYAVIYRYPVIMEDDLYWLDKDKEIANPGAGGDIFYRIPVALPFRVKNFDFFLFIMHLAWGNLERRGKEISALREFMLEEDASEDDWILVGDMNRYGKYGKSDIKAFDKLLEGNWESRYRFPLLEAITEPDSMHTYRASSDEYSTAIAKSKNIYDQVIITKGAYNEFAINEPVFGMHIGIIAFDMSEPFKSMEDHNKIKYNVSDHRPVWIRFRIDLKMMTKM